MADANHKARPLVTERFVTIRQSRRYQDVDALLKHPYTPPRMYSWMKLSGRWISDAGFKPGQRARIVVEAGRLIITPA
jgi:toxic protein SymE